MDFSTAPPLLGSKRKGSLSVSFECDPAEADELIDVAIAELRRLRQPEIGFTAEIVSSAKEKERREFEETIQTNGFWVDTVLDLYFARCHAVIGDIGATMSMWWRARSE